MNAVFFKVNMKTAFTNTQLVKGGWEVIEEDKLYERIKGKYRYSYVIKSFGKIRVSEIRAELNTEQKLIFNDMFEFNFSDAWKELWNKSFTPQSVEILIKENILGKLVENGWKPSVLGVIEYIQDNYELSMYYPAPEGESLFKLVDDNPGDVLNLIQKLKALNIM
jgi:hypothetical protein